jgi:hypothetical protein
MRDCILALIWPKAQVYQLFVDHGAAAADLKAVADFKSLGLSRAAIIDGAFVGLSKRAEGGLGVFRSLLKSLLEWAQFDPYYFDSLGKLDRAAADRCLAHLRQLQEIRDARIVADREKRAAAAAASARPTTELPELLREFLSLHSGSLPPAKRGYALERILRDLARLAQLQVTDPFRVIGEQIDGAVKYDGEHYVIEAKWEKAPSNNEAVYQFAGKVEGKMYGRGLFISVQGFTQNVVDSLVRGKALRTIFVDGEDLVLTLEGHITLAQLLDFKVKAAQTRGLIYVHPITGAPKAGEA